VIRASAAALLAAGMLFLSGCPSRGPAAAADAGSAAADGASKPAAATPAAPSAAVTKAARAVITDSCVACHDHQMLEQQRMTVAQWTAELDKMQKWGAPMEPAQKAALLAFASAHFSPSAGLHRAPALSAAEVEAQLAPTDDGPLAGGDAAAGATFFAQACAGCHGHDATGSALGVNLVDRPGLYRAAEFAAVVRDGRGRMPALPATDAQIAGLLAHLRRLPVEPAENPSPGPAPATPPAPR
jgi:mono/diheme cytochrome c family protein